MLFAVSYVVEYVVEYAVEYVVGYFAMFWSLSGCFLFAFWFLSGCLLFVVARLLLQMLVTPQTNTINARMN
jgi:hypothetical protein